MEVQAKGRVKPCQVDALLGGSDVEELGAAHLWLLSQFGDRFKSFNVFSVKA